MFYIFYAHVVFAIVSCSTIMQSIYCMFVVYSCLTVYHMIILRSLDTSLNSTPKTKPTKALSISRL